MTVKNYQIDASAAGTYLADRMAILDVIMLYVRGLDRLDAEAIRACFHPDGVDNHGPFTGSRDDFVDFAIECEAQSAWTQHSITSHNCDIDGDIAHVESYVSWVASIEQGVLGLGGGRYIDRFERRGGEWKISVRQLITEYGYKVSEDNWLGAEWIAVKGTRDRQDPSYQRPFVIAGA